MNINSPVGLLYHTYNSLFLSLPYKGIASTGTLLALFAQHCEQGLSLGKSPSAIIHSFMEEYLDESSEQERFDLLFQFIQYIERQVVLFDSVEDALFDHTHPESDGNSLEQLLGRVGRDPVKREELIDRLKHYSVRLVLTAHPTQFYPGKVLGIINDLGYEIKNNNLQDIRRLLMQLGKTAFVNRAKPTPLDEAASLGWYLENVFYEALPNIVFDLLKSCDQDVCTFPNPSILALGFWPGGDRDGNPFVLHDTTLKVAQRMRGRLLRCYHRDIRRLRRRLTFRGVEEIVLDAERKINNALYYPERDGYNGCEELIKDMLKAHAVLVEEHEGLFLEELERFILKVRLFGFHFSSLDIRQDSRKHQAVWEAIAEAKGKELGLDLNAWSDQDETTLVSNWLGLSGSLDPSEIQDEFARETLESVRTIKKIQTINGEAGCHRYVISNCRGASQVTQVLAMIRLVFHSQHVPVDIVPLFETVDDLAAAGKAMEVLYSNPDYRHHLEERGDTQTIMLGFSDGTKDGGYVAANWGIRQAKAALSEVSERYGISVLFFDGRGGPPGRGGGNNLRFYEAQGTEIANRGIQLTVQGQTVSSTYGTIRTARYHAQRLLAAGLRGALFPKEKTEERKQMHHTLDALAKESYQSYLALKGHEHFVPYLEQMTPLRWYGKTNIGSRPTRRGGSDELRFEDLRAIPFVGAWAQMKQNIPGYFGLGSAMESMRKDGKEKELRKLYSESLFFRALVDNSRQALSKSNFECTRYQENHAVFGGFWKLLHTEYSRTRDQIKWLTESDSLYPENPVSEESIQMREEIVLPLIVIQQFALQQIQDNPERFGEIYERLVLRAMFGIINAARNAA